MKRFLIILIFIISLCSCSTTQYVSYNPGVVNNYVGLSHHEIVELLGAPTREVSDGGSGYCLVYEGHRRLFSYSDKYASHSATLPTAQFFMTADGYCNRTLITNTQSVRTFSLGKTLLLLIFLGIIPIAA